MSLFYHFITLSLLLGSLLVHPTTAALVNRTIDDQYGDSMTKLMPIYSSSWSQGNDGSDAALKIDPSQAMNLTWHYISVPPSESNETVQSITLNFTGTALSVYCIIPNSDTSGHMTTTNMLFVLDGYSVGNYHYVGNQSTDVTYNDLVYTSALLLNQQHTFVLQATSVQGNTSTVLFDYAEYTTYDSGSSHLGAIVGGISGGVGATAIFLALFFRKKLLVRGKAKRPSAVREKIDEESESEEMTRVHQPFVLGLASSSSGYITSTVSSDTAMTQSHIDVDSIGPPVSERDFSHVVAPDVAPRSVTHRSVSGSIASGSIASGSIAPSSKAAMRQEELMRYVREMDHNQSYAASTVSSHNPSTDAEVAELRRQVEALWTQKQQLLAELADIPSPAYHA